MGWLYKHDPIDDPVAYLTDRYDYDDERMTHRVLAAARVANTVYMAIRFTDKAASKSWVSAAVILISNTRQHGFGYKDMCESMGPNECACPDRIIRLLSPVDDLPHPGYAASWRARVAAANQAAANLKKKRADLRPGSLVTLPHELSFRDGTKAAAFRLCFIQHRTLIFEPVDRPGQWSRLRAADLAAATISPPKDAAHAAPGDEKQEKMMI